MELYDRVYQIQSLYGGRNLFQYLFVGQNTLLVDTGIASTPEKVIFPYMERLKLNREIVKVATRWGEIRVKVSGAGGAPATVAPEYDDCRRAALENRVALRQVMEDALAAARKQLG
jgi:uncharacterized protein (DUF111 family)